MITSAEKYYHFPTHFYIKIFFSTLLSIENNPTNILLVFISCLEMVTVTLEEGNFSGLLGIISEMALGEGSNVSLYIAHL